MVREVDDIAARNRGSRMNEELQCRKNNDEPIA